MDANIFWLCMTPVIIWLVYRYTMDVVKPKQEVVEVREVVISPADSLEFSQTHTLDTLRETPHWFIIREKEEILEAIERVKRMIPHSAFEIGVAEDPLRCQKYYRISIRVLPSKQITYPFSEVKQVK